MLVYVIIMYFYIYVIIYPLTAAVWGSLTVSPPPNRKGGLCFFKPNSVMVWRWCAQNELVDDLFHQECRFREKAS